MKLQRAYSYKYSNVPRYKYLITIPEKIIFNLGWEPGTELAAKQKNGKLVIEFKSKPTAKIRKDPAPSISFEEFQEKIVSLLKNTQDLTWSQIREILSLPQIVPNNKWVSKMEKEIGLVRIKTKKGIVWKLS